MKGSLKVIVCFTKENQEILFTYLIFRQALGEACILKERCLFSPVLKFLLCFCVYFSLKNQRR